MTQMAWRMARVVSVAIFLTLGLAYLGLASNGTDESEWKAPAQAVRKANPLPADEATIKAGKKLYEAECLSCHGRFGRGDGPAARDLERAPGDLTDAKRMDAQTDGELFWKITEGRKPMPTLKKELTEEERWQLVHYVRTLGRAKK
ncbi:MAG: c-type cytochrome [Candidatus Omnitrophica bacterium]|nr:c-type cytochrome [Candidatus Omnitrophota bacterium]